jgi:hypothetical protein
MHRASVLWICSVLAFWQRGERTNFTARKGAGAQYRLHWAPSVVAAAWSNAECRGGGKNDRCPWNISDVLVATKRRTLIVCVAQMWSVVAVVLARATS